MDQYPGISATRRVAGPCSGSCVLLKLWTARQKLLNPLVVSIYAASFSNQRAQFIFLYATHLPVGEGYWSTFCYRLLHTQLARFH
jgi:hypothetical protein